MAKSVGTRTRIDSETETLVAHTLRASGFDASEDGSGRGTPLVPLHATGAHGSNGAGVGRDRDPSVTLDTTGDAAVAYGIRHDAWRDGEARTPGPDAAGNVRLRDPGLGISEELAPTVDAARPHAVAVQEPMAFNWQSGGTANFTGGTVGRPDALSASQTPAVVAPSLTAFNMDSRSPQSEEQQRAVAAVFASTMTVRRLTPLECERLQGLPNYWTWVPYPRPKPKAKVTRLAKDAPRYKAIGNGIALPCLVWVGQRIAMVDELLSEIRECAAPQA